MKKRKSKGKNKNKRSYLDNKGLNKINKSIYKSRRKDSRIRKSKMNNRKRKSKNKTKIKSKTRKRNRLTLKRLIKSKLTN